MILTTRPRRALRRLAVVHLIVCLCTTTTTAITADDATKRDDTFRSEYTKNMSVNATDEPGFLDRNPIDLRDSAGLDDTERLPDARNVSDYIRFDRNVSDASPPRRRNDIDDLGDMSYDDAFDDDDVDLLSRTTDTPGDDDNCTNDYCIPHDDYMDIIKDYIFPTSYEWILITALGVTFVVGLVGNALVCLAVYRNHSMRSVTNYFIVNLAVADFMVILFCLPPTVIWDVTETWFLGAAMCKVILYLQTVSVTVSVLTLTFISIDRWYAICYPLKFKSTTGRAKTAIIVIWLIALVFDIPELVTLTTEKRVPSLPAVYFTQCRTTWSPTMDAAWSALKMLLLYALPLAFTSIAYRRIVKVLWHAGGCQNAASSTTASSDRIAGGGSVTEALNVADQTSINSTSRASQSSRIMTTTTTASSTTTFGGQQSVSRSGRSTFTMNANASTEGQLRSRRKAAKMLVAVVIMFAVCYFPVHVFTLLKHLTHIPQTDGLSAIALLSHWLCYANSAVNPIIYNFMSGKYRREFKRAFGQCQRTRRRPVASRCRRGDGDDDARRSTFSPKGVRLYCNVYRSRTVDADARVETDVALFGDRSTRNGRTRTTDDVDVVERAPSATPLHEKIRRSVDDADDDDANRIAWR